MEEKVIGKLLGDHFKHAREAKGLTARELGELANVSYTVIYDLEKNRAIPKVATLLKLIEALDIEMSKVFGSIITSCNTQIQYIPLHQSYSMYLISMGLDEQDIKTVNHVVNGLRALKLQ